MINIPHELVAVGGKNLRRSHDRSNGKSAIHMVKAWAVHHGLVLGQVKTDAKSNEITTIPELLKLLDLKGSVVTVDAMGCQKEMAKPIVEQEADYVFFVKGNQGNLHKEVELLFQDVKNNDFKDLPHDFFTPVDGEPGTIIAFSVSMQSATSRDECTAYEEKRYAPIEVSRSGSLSRCFKG
jgi:hypothetical protein